MRRLSRVAPPGSREAALVHRLDGGAERRIDRSRQARALVDRLEARRAAVVHQRADARGRQVRQFGQRLLEEVDVAGEQGAQHQAGGELAGLAQMADQRRHLTSEVGREVDGRLLAGFLRDALGPVLVHPVARDHEARERLGQLDHQRVSGRGRQVGPGEQRLADRREMAEALRRCGRARIARCRRWDSRSASGRPPPIRPRRARPRPSAAASRAARSRSASVRRRPRRNRPDRSRAAAASAPARRSDVRLIVDQRVHHGRPAHRRSRRARRRAQAHQRRGIVEQQDHRAFGGGAIIRREIGVEIGAGQCAGRFRALGGFRGTDPLQELTNNHDQPTQRAASRAAIASRLSHAA